MSINPSTIIPDVQATSHNEDCYRPGPKSQPGPRVGPESGQQPMSRHGPRSAVERFVEQLGRHGAVHIAAPQLVDDVLGGRYPVEGERPS